MANTATNRAALAASRLNVPEEYIISVEHPCIVKNVEKAIDMIGGASAISQAVEANSDKTFALSFRPQDPTSKTIVAKKRNANNVLLRISVPKRTGRKRKRGSNDPWTEGLTAETVNKDASYLANCIADNIDSYEIAALSTIPSMHIWRSLPDFVYSTSNIGIVGDAKDMLLSQHYPTVKDFQIGRTYGMEDTTTLPPPVWSNQQIPGNYTYRQNPSVKLSHDPITGKSVVGNTQAPPKTFTYQIAWDDAEYPTAMMPEITPLGKQTPIIGETVRALQTLFERRPIWSRRALLNCLPSHLSSFNVVRFCLGYVSYAIRSGPWRDTLVRLGIDPRKDPKYRIYQTIMLQLVPKANQLALAPGVSPRKTTSYKAKAKSNSINIDESLEVPASGQGERDRLLESRRIFQRKWTGSDNATSHIFDGLSPLPPDGKVWQLCDFTDPQLAALRDVSVVHIRAECETRYFGWYENGTNAKIRVALKAKVEALAEGKVLEPELIEGFLQLPEKLVFEVDTDAATNAAIAYPLDLEETTETRTVATTAMPNSGAVSAYLGDKPTTQQLYWAAAYRSFAKTGLGSVPASGASGKGRLTKSKPTARKSFIGDENGQISALETNSQHDQQGSSSNINTATGSQLVDIRSQANDAAESEPFEIHEGPPHEDDVDVLPSIEADGFGVDDDGDSELGLEDEDPTIKMEEGDDQTNET